MKNLLKTCLSIVILMLCFSFSAKAQFLKNLEKALNKNGDKDNSKKEAPAEVKKDERNEWAKTHAGQVVFYNKFLSQKDANTDNESGIISSGIVASNAPLYFRAYLEKNYKTSCPDCDNLEIRYTMGGKSITTQELRNDMPEYYQRMYSVISFYDYKNYAVGIALNSAKAKYAQDQTLQEEAYRILLSRIEGQLTKGASLTLKVEIMGLNSKIAESTILATGEIPLKVTDESYSLQNLSCRCGKPGITDAAITKDIKDAFTFQFDDVEAVYKVVLLDREFTMNYDNSYPVKNVVSKGMWANIIYKGSNGIYMMVKRYVFYKKTDSGFSDKASIGKHSYYLPVSPTCSK